MTDPQASLNAPEDPIHDPYLVKPPPPERQSVLAVMSIAALIAGPLGSIASVALGLLARRAIRRSNGALSGRGLASVGVALGFTLTAGYAVAFGVIAWTRAHREDTSAPSRPRPEPSITAPPSIPSAPVARRSRPPIEPVAPRTTRVEQKGAITVVDVGVSARSLEDELSKQRAEAATKGQTLLVMTTAGGCEPCRGVDASLADDRLQKALASVRLVRVDVNVFDDDLTNLAMPHAAIPGFFLPATDLTPRDGIDGGEWDDDIPENIAPVLGRFVKGTYDKRRSPWKAPSVRRPSGISL